MQSRSAGNLKGCDLSHYEANVDIAAAPGNIVYLKASEGHHTRDPSFDTLYSKCLAAGKKIGAYHFLHIGGNYQVAPQVELAAQTILEKQLDCLYGIDIEDGGYHGGSSADVTTQILEFADKFTARTGIPCCVYASTAFIREHFTADLRRLPLWVAHYGVSTPGDNGIWNSWAGFQYTDKPYDLDEFTTGILIGGAAVQPSAAKQSASSDVYAVSSLPCDWNARAGCDFDVRSADGTPIAGREVSRGDCFIICSVNYDRQLAEVIYPTPHCWVHGWITNLQSKIPDRWHFKWRNGSTAEAVYGSPAGNDRIGSIGPHEYATPLFAAAGRYAVLYNTAKGDETKFGYVDYHGGFNF